MTWYWCFMPASRHLGLSSWGMLNLEQRERKEKHTQSDYQLLTRRINVNFYIHPFLIVTHHYPCGPPQRNATTDTSVFLLWDPFWHTAPSLLQTPKYGYNKILKRLLQNSNWPIGDATFMQNIFFCLSASLFSIIMANMMVTPLRHPWGVKGHHLTGSAEVKVEVVTSFISKTHFLLQCRFLLLVTMKSVTNGYF